MAFHPGSTRPGHVARVRTGLLLLAFLVFCFPTSRVFAETWCNTSPAYQTTNCAIGGIVSESWAFQNAPASGLTSITFPFTVFSIPSASGYFFAQQFSFVDTNNESGQGAYIGMQPAGNGQNNAHFSFFGTGSSAVNSKNCTTGADSGSGTTCQVVVPFVTGHQYNLTVYRDKHNPDVWHGEIVDYTACQVAGSLNDSRASSVCTPTEIGAWDIGYETALSSSQGGFVEYFPSEVAQGCSGLPYADVEFMTPTTPSGLDSTVNNEYSYGGCNNQVNYSGSQSTHNLWVRAETGW
ncbi:hypothetical protein GCM10007863_32690 [Dyella mobilis]|nr:hypothetical protein GCM10007863_32690 [Dyella mobilis]